MPVKLFISCAPKDGILCQELINHLKSSFQESVSIWYNQQIIAGTEYHKEVDKQLKNALIILLLISSDFLADNYYYGIEMRNAMQRHDAGEACVIPILLRPVNWGNAPFAKLQALPKGDKFITNYPDQDAGWLEVADGIRDAINHLPLSASNTKNGKISQSRTPVLPPGETDLNNSNSTLTTPTGGSPSTSGQVQVQQPGNVNNTSYIPLFKRRWFLVPSFSAIILLVVVVIFIVSHLLVGKTKIQLGTTTLQFKEIVTEGNPMPVSIVQGDDKNIWFTNDQGEIGKVEPDNSITMKPLGSGVGGGATGLTGIANGPDKNIWFTMTGKSVIGRFNVNVDSFSYFSLPSAQDKRGTAITTGPDGNLWYVLGGISMAKIGCMTRMGVPCGEYDLGSGVNPSSIINAGGKLWFTEFDGNSIGWMIPGSDTKPHIISLSGQPFNMASEPDGEIWFTEPNIDRLGHIGADGSLLAEVLLTNLAPESIAIASDGSIWFTAWSNGAKQPGGKIEHFSSDGKRMIASYPFPTASFPAHGITQYDNGNGIAVASNGQIWFIEYQGTAGPAKIGYSQQ